MALSGLLPSPARPGYVVVVAGRGGRSDAIVTFVPGETTALEVARDALSSWGLLPPAASMASVLAATEELVFVGRQWRVALPSATTPLQAESGEVLRLLPFTALRRRAVEAATLRLAKPHDLVHRLAAARGGGNASDAGDGDGDHVTDAAASPNSNAPRGSGIADDPSAAASPTSRAGGGGETADDVVAAPLTEAEIRQANSELRPVIVSGACGHLVCAKCGNLPHDPVCASCCGGTMCRTCARRPQPGSDDDNDSDVAAAPEVCGACGLDAAPFELTPRPERSLRIARFVAHVRAAIAAQAEAIAQGEAQNAASASSTAPGILGAMPGAALLSLPAAAAAAAAASPGRASEGPAAAGPGAPGAVAAMGGGPPPPPDYATTMAGVTVAAAGPAWKARRQEWMM